MKRILSYLIIFCLVFSFIPNGIVFAENTTNEGTPENWKPFSAEELPGDPSSYIILDSNFQRDLTLDGNKVLVIKPDFDPTRYEGRQPIVKSTGDITLIIEKDDLEEIKNNNGEYITLINTSGSLSIISNIKDCKIPKVDSNYNDQEINKPFIVNNSLIFKAGDFSKINYPLESYLTIENQSTEAKIFDIVFENIKGIEFDCSSNGISENISINYNIMNSSVVMLNSNYDTLTLETVFDENFPNYSKSYKKYASKKIKVSDRSTLNSEKLVLKSKDTLVIESPKLHNIKELIVIGSNHHEAPKVNLNKGIYTIGKLLLQNTTFIEESSIKGAAGGNGMYGSNGTRGSNGSRGESEREGYQGGYGGYKGDGGAGGNGGAKGTIMGSLVINELLNINIKDAVKVNVDNLILEPISYSGNGGSNGKIGGNGENGLAGEPGGYGESTSHGEGAGGAGGNGGNGGRGGSVLTSNLTTNSYTGRTGGRGNTSTYYNKGGNGGAGGYGGKGSSGVSYLGYWFNESILSTYTSNALNGGRGGQGGDGARGSDGSQGRAESGDYEGTWSSPGRGGSGGSGGSGGGGGGQGGQGGSAADGVGISCINLNIQGDLDVNILEYKIGGKGGAKSSPENTVGDGSIGGFNRSKFEVSNNGKLQIHNFRNNNENKGSINLYSTTTKETLDTFQNVTNSNLYEKSYENNAQSLIWVSTKNNAIADLSSLSLKDSLFNFFNFKFDSKDDSEILLTGDFSNKAQDLLYRQFKVENKSAMYFNYLNPDPSGATRVNATGSENKFKQIQNGTSEPFSNKTIKNKSNWEESSPKQMLHATDRSIAIIYSPGLGEGQSLVEYAQNSQEGVSYTIKEPYDIIREGYYWTNWVSLTGEKFEGGQRVVLQKNSPSLRLEPDWVPSVSNTTITIEGLSSEKVEIPYNGIYKDYLKENLRKGYNIEYYTDPSYSSISKVDLNSRHMSKDKTFQLYGKAVAKSINVTFHNHSKNLGLSYPEISSTTEKYDGYFHKILADVMLNQNSLPGYNLKEVRLNNSEGRVIQATDRVKSEDDIDIYIIWEPKTLRYTLPKQKEIVIEHDQKWEDVRSKMPNIEGYNFKGFFLDEEGNNAFSFDTETTVNIEDLKTTPVYPVYKPKTLTVILNIGDGHFAESVDQEIKSTKTIRVNYDRPYTKLPILEKPGYMYTWHIENESGIEVNNETIVNLTEDHILVAKWELVPYNLNFIGADGQSKKISIKYNEKYSDKLTSDLINKDGYTTEGIYKETISPENKIDLASEKHLVQGDLNLVINWVANKYTLSYVDGEGIQHETENKIAYNTKYLDTLPSVLEKEGYRFLGYFFEAGTKEDSKKVTEESIFKELNNDKVVYSYFEALPAVIEIRKDSGELIESVETRHGVPYKSLIESREKPEKVGYTAGDWTYFDGSLIEDSNLVNVNNIKNIKLNYTTNKVRVRYKYFVDRLANEMTLSSEKEETFDSAYTNVPEPVERKGYQFIGWKLNDEEGSVIDLNKVKIAEDHTLCAFYSVKKKLEFNKNPQSYIQSGGELKFEVFGPVKSGFTIEYKVNNNWVSVPPTKEGAYDVRISRSEDEEYAEVVPFEISNGLTIKKNPYLNSTNNTNDQNNTNSTFNWQSDFYKQNKELEKQIENRLEEKRKAEEESKSLENERKEKEKRRQEDLKNKINSDRTKFELKAGNNNVEIISNKADGKLTKLDTKTNSYKLASDSAILLNKKAVLLVSKGQVIKLDGSEFFLSVATEYQTVDGEMVRLAAGTKVKIINNELIVLSGKSLPNTLQKKEDRINIKDEKALNKLADFNNTYEFLKNRGLMVGNSSKVFDFKPNDKMTNAMLSQVFYNWVKPNNGVSNGTWWENSSKWAISNGLIVIDKGDFKPNEAVTSEIVINTISRFLDMYEIDLKEIKTYKPDNDYYKIKDKITREKVKYLYETGVISNIKEFSNLNKNLTRAEFAKILARLVVALEN